MLTRPLCRHSVHLYYENWQLLQIHKKEIRVPLKTVCVSKIMEKCDVSHCRVIFHQSATWIYDKKITYTQLSFQFDICNISSFWGTPGINSGTTYIHFIYKRHVSFSILSAVSIWFNNSGPLSPGLTLPMLCTITYLTRWKERGTMRFIPLWGTMRFMHNLASALALRAPPPSILCFF